MKKSHLVTHPVAGQEIDFRFSTRRAAYDFIYRIPELSEKELLNHKNRVKP